MANSIVDTPVLDERDSMRFFESVLDCLQKHSQKGKVEQTKIEFVQMEESYNLMSSLCDGVLL